MECIVRGFHAESGVGVKPRITARCLMLEARCWVLNLENYFFCLSGPGEMEVSESPTSGDYIYEKTVG